MLEKIKQEIVVIIISISSMLITAFSTIYGVNITNEHNLKIQNRQIQIEEAKQEIEKLENLSSKFISLYAKISKYNHSVPVDDFNNIFEEIRVFGNELTLITVDELILDKFKEFMKVSLPSYAKENKQNEMTKIFSDLLKLIEQKKIKYKVIIMNGNL
jgi:hypothetical protein